MDILIRLFSWFSLSFHRFHDIIEPPTSIGKRFQSQKFDHRPKISHAILNWSTFTKENDNNILHQQQQHLFHIL